MSEISVEDRLDAMGLALPTPPAPIGNFLPWRRAGDLLFLSGQGPVQPDGTLARGVVGRDIDTATAAGHARDTALVLLAVAKEAAGGFDQINCIVKLLGMVNAAPEFGDHPKVIKGASDLLVELLGNRGRHARSAVGMGSLPGGITVEIEAIFQLK